MAQAGFDSRYAPALQAHRVNLPDEFDITFTQPGQGDISFPSNSFATQGIQSNITIRNVTEGINHVPFLFYDDNADGLFNAAKRGDDEVQARAVASALEPESPAVRTH